MSKNGIYDKPDLRKTTEGTLYKSQSGCPWRDLPKDVVSWNKIYKKFNDWSKYSKLFNIFEDLIENLLPVIL